MELLIDTAGNNFNPQVIPLWTGFNGKITELLSCLTVISSTPVVNPKPTDMSTEYIMMKKYNDM